MKYRNYKNSGESIMEIMISVVILSIVIMSASKIIAQAIGLNVNIKQRVIAVGLAQEGIEIVRNIRDTNWIKYSGNKREKWLCQDTADTNPQACYGAALTELISIDQALVSSEVGTATSFKPLFYTDADNSRYYLENSAGPELLYQDNTTKKYSHNTTGGTASIFSREIILTLKQDDNCVSATSGLSPQRDCDDILDVISQVTWTDETGGQSVTLETLLYDFWERENYK